MWSRPGSYHWWRSRGLTTVWSLLSLNDTYDIPSSEKFHYLQICHLLESLTKKHDWSRTATAFETRCWTSTITQGLISLLYSSILNNSNSCVLCYCSNWERDFGAAQAPEAWKKIWEALLLSSCNVTNLENFFKVLSCRYFTPTRTAKCFPTYPSTCFRRCSDLGVMQHIWWTCPKVKRLDKDL